MLTKLKSLPTMTLLAVIPWCLAFSVAAGNVPDISDIRLVNGSGPYGGRVEIQIDGIWGTVCDDTFDFSVATVMCKMMNLKASTYMTGARYGQGLGPIFANEFNCDGNERHLKECSYVSNMQCTHARDIGIICSECPHIDIRNGNVVDISPEGNVLSAMCKDGFTSNTLTSNCSNGIWSPPSLKCIHDITDIRLVNGIGLYDGRVELLVNGTWGTICSTSFRRKEAVALCRTIFGSKFNSISYEKSYKTSRYYGPGDGPIYMDNLDCDSSATSINECSYNLDVSCTDHTHDVAVACHVSPLIITDTRLVNGTGPYDGRIELFVDGYWGTICNRYINMYDAQTICNTHNASLAAYFTTTTYGEGTGPILIENIMCNSARDHIRDCYVQLPYRPSCTHDNDLSVVCTPCGLPKIYNGEAFSFNNTELTVKCQSGFFPDFIKMRCLDNGTWAEDQRCTSFYAYPLDISEIRLKNWRGYYHIGRVELSVNGTWGTVCDTDFDREAAAVVCRMLGLEYEKFYTIVDRFNRGSGAIFVDKLNCNGSERHVNNCTYEISNNCTHYNDVAVVCTGFQLNITDIRLADGPQPSQGRVEIKYLNTWGTICNDHFGISEANLICRMVGYTRAHSFHIGAFYGEGKGPIFVDDLDCKENATDLNDCTYTVDHNCGHDEDISVVCTACGLQKIYNGEAFSFNNTELTVKCQSGFFPDFIKMRCLDNGTWAEDQRCTSVYAYPLDISEIRLQSWREYYHKGRVELFVNGTWGTVCDTDFDREAAAVVCRMLGLEYKSFYTSVYGGRGTIFVDKLNCNGSERHVNNCTYEISNYCTHYDDVVVDCTGFQLNITGIRLADGPQPSQGRVEIKYLNTWGTICGDNFGISEANLICRMIGYTRAQSFHTGAFYGEGKGPVFVDDLDCKENATDLNDCTYTVNHYCFHRDDISVVCTGCGDPTPENGFVNTSSTTYQTVVHVTCDKDYKLLGEENIICQANWTWSNRPVCKRIDCGDPTPKNGSSNSSTTANGAVALIECEEGYDLTGEAIITCQLDETWTDTPFCVIKEAVGGDSDKLIIILTVCIGSFAIAIIGLVIVKTFRKRNSTPRTVQESIAATGNEADTYHHVDNPTNIQPTDRGSETNMYESLGEVDQQTSMTQSHYNMLTPTERHYQNSDHDTMETKETSFYENLAL